MSSPTPQEETELRERLRALRVDPAPGGFEASLHRRLAAAGPPEEPGLWHRLGILRAAPWLWPAVGATAGLALVVGIGFVSRPTVEARTEVATRGTPAVEEAVATQVPASRVAMIRLNLTAEVASDDAQIQVTLPEGLVFWSHGEALAQRSFSWSQALAAGDNDIPIAIRGQRPGRYRVTVVAQTGSTQVQDEVLLEVTNG